MSPERTVSLSSEERQEFRRVERDTPTPSPDGWEAHTPTLPFLHNTEEAVQAARAAIEERQRHLTKKQSIEAQAGWLIKRTRTQEIEVANPIPEMTVRAFDCASYLDTLGKDVAFTGKHGLSLHAEPVAEQEEGAQAQETSSAFMKELEKLLETEEGEIVAAELAVFTPSIPRTSRIFSRLIDTWSDITTLAADAAKKNTDARYANSGVDQLSQTTEDQAGELDWKAWRIPTDVNELQPLVIKRKKNGGTVEDVVFTPGEIVLLHPGTDNHPDAMIRIKKLKLDPELRVSLKDPKLDLETTEPLALEQAIHFLVAERACKGDTKLSVIRALQAETLPLLEQTDPGEILNHLQQTWGQVFEPFTQRIEEDLRVAYEHQQTLEAEKNWGRVKKTSTQLVRKVNPWYKPAHPEGVATPDEIRQRCVEQVEKLLRVLRAEVLKAIKPEQLKREQDCRVARQILDRVDVPRVVVAQAKEALLPLHKAILQEGLEEGESYRLNSPDRIVNRLENLLTETSKFMAKAKARYEEMAVVEEALLEEAADSPFRDQLKTLLRERAQPTFSLTTLHAQLEELNDKVIELPQSLTTARDTLIEAKHDLTKRGQGMNEQLEERKDALREVISEFFDQWVVLLEQPNVAYFYDQFQDAEESSLMELNAKLLLDALRENYPAIIEEPLRVQRDLAVRLSSTALRQTSLGFTEFSVGGTFAAVPVLIDSLMFDGITENILSTLQENAVNSLIDDLLSNGHPTQ